KLLRGGWNSLAPDGYLNTQGKTKKLPKAERLKHAREKKWVITDPVQFKVWREAWDLLLEDKLSLIEICETLHARGYCVRVVPLSQSQRRESAKLFPIHYREYFTTGSMLVG